MKTKALALGASLALLLTLATPDSAHACSCAPRSFPELAAGATAIFEGRAVSVERVPNSPDAAVAEFAVVQAWRGVTTERVRVSAGTEQSMCGYRFEPGRTYLVLAHADSDGGLNVSLCSGTRRIEEATDERRSLGAGVVPVDVPADPAPATEQTERSTPSSSTAPTTPRSDEPVRVPPRGGCAGCAATTGGSSSLGLLLALGFGVLARRRVGNR